MKIVMFADLHLERQFAWADPAAASRRRLGLRSTLTNVVALAVHERADAILCGGDLYEDEFFSPDLLKFVASTVDCGIPVFFSPGNHDHLSSSSLYARASLPATAHVFTTAELSPVELAPGLRLWGGAHLTPSGTPGFFDRGPRVDAGVKSGVNLALFHGSERGGFRFEGEEKHPHAPFDAEQIARAGFDYAFVGHHHRSVVGSHHCYPGNPDPLAFGEDGDRGAVVAEVSETGEVIVSHHRVAASTTHSLSVDLTGCDHGTDVVTRVEAALAAVDGFVRLDLTGEVHPDVEIDKHQINSLGRDLDGFVLREQVRRSYLLEDILAEDDSVRAHFVHMVQHSADLSPSDRELMIELGLRAFDNRRDLEVI